MSLSGEPNNTSPQPAGHYTVQFNMFSRLFQNQEDSDVTVVLKCPDPAKMMRTVDARVVPFREVKRFPAHKVLLKAWSEKMRAQVCRG